MSKLRGSRKATQFTESVIREMTRLNDMYGGVNLWQGFPDFSAPPPLNDAPRAPARKTLTRDPRTGAARPLPQADPREFTRRYGLDIVADEQVTVCCGSTEAMMSTMLSIIDPG